MESLYLLIPLALLVAIAAGAVFVWAAGNGQFDDLDQHGKLPPDD